MNNYKVLIFVGLFNLSIISMEKPKNQEEYRPGAMRSLHNITTSFKNWWNKKPVPPRSVYEILPKEIWVEIIERLGVNPNGETPKEIFKNMDNMRLTSKQSKEVVDAYVQKVGNSKKLNGLWPKDKLYTYLDFKKDIFADILQKQNEKIDANIEDYLKDDNKFSGPLSKLFISRLKNLEFKMKMGIKNKKKYEAIPIRDLTFYDVSDVWRSASLEENYEDKVEMLILYIKSRGASLRAPRFQRPGKRDQIYLLNLLLDELGQAFRRHNPRNAYDMIRFIEILLDFGADPYEKEAGDTDSFFLLDIARHLLSLKK